MLVSAAISPAGPPRQIVTAWTNERFELIVSPSVLDELADVLARPKFRRFITTAIAVAFIEGLAAAVIVADPPDPPSISPDPDDDYLIALARAARADYLVSGDRHLLDLTDPDPPVLTPRQFLDQLDT
ncbi:MAG: putative toxin-antitoxin system toxin component, PIN family [Solirubrobacteraceae bacterium]